MRRFILSIAAILFFCYSDAQNFSNKGKDFWVAYGYHVRMSSNNAQDMVLYFATDEVTNISITIPSLGYTQNLTSGPTPTVLTSAVIPKAGAQDARLTAESTAPEDKAIHITSDKPMVAYAHIYNSSQSGATILFPTNTLGKEYYSINYTNVSNENFSNCWMYVIATDTGTTSIEITPSANTINHPAGVPFTITMTQGQVFNLMGQLTGGGGGGGGGGTYTGVDLTGSKIKSIASGNGACKRIAVFSGSGKIGINCGSGTISADNYMVQAFPKDAWGKKFLTIPTSSMDHNIYRICVSNPATVVNVNGAPITYPLTNNFYYEIPATNTPFKIESDLPITVAQYITTQGTCGNPSANTNPGDPEVIYLSPVEQNIAKVLWNATPNFNILEHYYNVIIPNSGTAISSFKLDGVTVNPALFTVHPQDPAYSYLSQQLTASGVHSIESDSGFNAIAYGLGSAESYGYNAGTNIRDLYNFLQPVNPWSIVPDPVACTGTPVYLSVTFPFQPTSLYWNFNANPVQSPNTNVTVNNPVSDSTYFIGTRQVWRYKLPTLYNFSLANSSPGYPITITAGTTSSEGCGNSVDREFTLAVYDPPVADMHWFHNGCVTDTVRFRDTTVYLAGTYSYKWFWDFGDGTRDSVRYPRHKYNLPGTYTVKFWLISNVGCFSDTAVETIVVTAVPTVGFTTSVPHCQGSNITFTSTASVATPGNLQKWYWDFGDGTTQVITAPASSTIQHAYATWGTKQPSLKVETNSGCVSPADTIPLYIGPIPLASFSMPAGICLPSDTASFQSTSTIADGSQAQFSYLWTFGDAPSGSNDTAVIGNPDHYYNNPGPFSIHLTVTSNEGCIDDTVRVLSNVYPQPISGFNVAPQNCLGDPTSFSSTSSGSGHNITNWYWDFGDGSPIGSGATVSHTYLTAGPKIIRHWIKTDVGCYSDTTEITITVNPLPTASFTVTGPYCTQRDITFTNTSVANAGNIVSWNWNLGDGTIFLLNNGNAFTHLYTGTGLQAVTLVVTTDRGCVSPQFVEDIFINPKPVAGFIDPEVCLDDTYAQFTDTSSVALGSVTQWLWNFDDPLYPPNTSTIANPRHSYQTIGPKNVQLIVTTAAGCKDTTVQNFYVNGDIPVADFEVLNRNRLCANDSVRIKDHSTVDVGYVVKTEIYWDNIGAPTVFETDDYPDSGKIYSHLYPNFQSPASVTYQIRFRSYSGATCIDDHFETITVYAAPAVSFNPIPDTCLNIAPFLITQAAETGGVPGTFVFTGPGVSPNGSFDPLSVGAGTDTMMYTYTSVAGCKDSASQHITILVPPVANFGFIAPYCEQRTVTFRDSSAAPVGTLTTWTWNFGDGTPPMVRNVNTPFTHVFAAAGDYDVKLVVTTDDGCNSVVKIKSIHINPQPLARFDFTDTACLPFAVIQFNNTSAIADGTENTFRYSWNFGDPGSGSLNTSTAIQPSHTYNTVGPYNVRLTVTSGAGCVDDTLIAVNTIHPQPEADFSFNVPAICIGDNVRMTDQSDPKDGVLSQWYWNFGDGGTDIVAQPIHTFPDTGTFEVSHWIINSFGCNSDTALKTIHVYPYPLANAGPDLLILEGQNAAFQSTASGSQLQYLWNPGTYLNNTGVLSPICTPLDDLTYTFIVIGQGGCATTDQVDVKVLRNPLIPNTFSPNKDGVNDKWVIEYLKDYPFAKVQVFTRTGQLVFESGNGYTQPWDGTSKGNLLPVDTYYYIIEPASGRAPVTGYVTIIR